MRDWKTSVRLLAAALATGCLVQAAFATPVIDYDGTLDRARNDQYTIGDLFTVGNNALTVTALGAQDFGTGGANTDGFEGGSVPVGIWSADGSTQLATANVLSADPLDGTYRYHTLDSPITLSANTSYLIGALVGKSGDGTVTTEYWGDSDDPSRGATPDSYSSGLVTLDAARVAFAQLVLTAPTSPGGGLGTRWAPANFEATVPEPASCVLFGLGAIGLLAVARRRLF